jgi:hypothetical protein
MIKEEKCQRKLNFQFYRYSHLAQWLDTSQLAKVLYDYKCKASNKMTKTDSASTSKKIRKDYNTRMVTKDILVRFSDLLNIKLPTAQRFSMYSTQIPNIEKIF